MSPPARPPWSGTLRPGLALVLVLALGACSTPPSPPQPDPSRAAVAAPTPPPLSAPRPTDAAPAAVLAVEQVALDRLFAAGAVGDRTAWDAGTAALDAAFAVRATLLFDNLHRLRPARLRVRLTGAEQHLAPARQAVLGTGARVLQAELAWRLPGERADATSSVWLTLVPGGSQGARLAGTDDGSALDRPGLPLWWLGPVTRVTRGDVTVLVGPGQPAARWAHLAGRAAADARAHLPGPQRRAWDGHLVVEVPGNGDDFDRVLGAAPAAYATTAAVTRPEGPTTRAAVRVVVNPATARDPDAELATTLTHEAVHVATRSASTPGPLWAEEGLAEYVALAAHPDQRDDELAPLRAASTRSDRHARLPADRAFTAGGKDVTSAYAQAWIACRAVAEHRSPTDLGRFYAALAAGQPVERAARTTLGVHRSTLERWWRDALRRAVARG